MPVPQVPARLAAAARVVRRAARVERAIVLTTNPDDERHAPRPHVADRGEVIDVGLAEAEAFEQNIRDQERRRRTIAAAAVTLALAGALTFIVVAAATRPRGYATRSSESNLLSSYTAPDSPTTAVVDAGTAPPRPEPTAPHPSRLPMCREPTTPPALRAMCQLDAPAASAVFECTEPMVTMLWPRAVKWICPPDVPGQAGPISIALVFDREGDMPEPGDPVGDGDPRVAPRGVIRKVSVTLRELDRGAASGQVEQLLAAARGWGCVELVRPPYRGRRYDQLERITERFEREHEERRRLAMEHEIDCGAQWKIRVSYIDLGTPPLLVLEAASPLGFELTDLGSARFPTTPASKIRSVVCRGMSDADCPL